MPWAMSPGRLWGEESMWRTLTLVFCCCYYLFVWSLSHPSIATRTRVATSISFMFLRRAGSTCIAMTTHLRLPHDSELGFTTLNIK